MSVSRRLLLTSCLLAIGCTTGGDDTIPPTLDAISKIENLTPDPRKADDFAAERETAARDLPLKRAAAGDLASTDNIPESGVFQVEFITTEGKFLVEVNRKWAPIGADRFYQLVKDKFFDDAGFFRVVPGFMVQFGLPADPARNEKWSQNLKDDPVITGNARGYVTFAKTNRPNSRTTQLFINYKHNPFLDKTGFAAFGRVIEGMDTVDRINSEYGEQPSQAEIRDQGNAYLNSRFPNLSYIQTARVILDDLAPASSE